MNSDEIILMDKNEIEEYKALDNDELTMISKAAQLAYLVSNSENI